MIDAQSITTDLFPDVTDTPRETDARRLLSSLPSRLPFLCKLTIFPTPGSGVGGPGGSFNDEMKRLTKKS